MSGLSENGYLPDIPNDDKWDMGKENIARNTTLSILLEIRRNPNIINDDTILYGFIDKIQKSFLREEIAR